MGMMGMIGKGKGRGLIGWLDGWMRFGNFGSKGGREGKVYEWGIIERKGDLGTASSRVEIGNIISSKVLNLRILNRVKSRI